MALSPDYDALGLNAFPTYGTFSDKIDMTVNSLPPLGESRVFGVNFRAPASRSSKTDGGGTWVWVDTPVYCCSDGGVMVDYYEADWKEVD